jgi:hypothetical protein
MSKKLRHIRGKGAESKISSISPLAAIALAREKIRFMRCHKHGQVRGLSPDRDSFSFSTCCDDFRRRVIQVLMQE